MTKAAAIPALLLAFDAVLAFIPNAPARSLHKHATGGTSPTVRATPFKPFEKCRPSTLVEADPCASGHGKWCLFSGDGTPSWRYEVDDLIKAASPWGSLVETEIIATDLLKRLPEVAADVSAAARRGTLISEVVLPRGTEARFTVDGLKAVNRQLREDILPKVKQSAPKIAKAVSEARAGATTTPSVSGVGRKPTDSRSGPMEGIAEGLYAIRNAVRDLSPQKIREGLETISSEAENVVSRTPSGLYSPEYVVEEAREGFEVRRYASYAICSATMVGDVTFGNERTAKESEGATDGSGEGFNTLAGYLFGNNTQERAMDMTTPVNIDVSPTRGRTMSFVMPKDITAGKAPVPRDPRVGVSDVAGGEVLAVREFPGFATDGEVERQVDSLLGALEREATRPREQFAGSGASAADQESPSPWRAEDPSGLSYRLMQYNPPYTLPWLRTNAIAIKVSREEGGATGSTGVDVVETAISEALEEGREGRSVSAVNSQV